MPKFVYTATSSTGQQLRGEQDAPDIESVYSFIRQEGYFPVTVNKVSETGMRVTKEKIKTKPLATFCTQLATVLRSGVPLSTTLEILAAQTEYLPLKKIIEDVYTKILSGRGLYESFRVYSENFPSIFLNMIEAGEASGQLDHCVSRAADTLTRNARLNSRVKGAMIYPMVLLVLMVGITLMLMTVVIPQFATMFENSDAELPALTKVLLAMSNFVVTRWYVLIAVVVGLVFGIRAMLANKNIRYAFDRQKLSLPVIGPRLKKIITARFARTLVTMISAGIPLTTALEVSARSLNNKFMEAMVYEVNESVRLGQGMSTPMAKLGVFPPMVVHMTRLGEASGELESLLENTAEFFEEESDAAIQGLMALMEPMLIVLLAALVLPVILGILLPMFNLSQAIS